MEKKKIKEILKKLFICVQSHFYCLVYWLHSLSPDKRTHVDIGMFSGIVFLLMFILFEIVYFPIIIPVVLIALIIEIYDKCRNNGTGFDWQDLKCTIYGGFPIVLLQYIYVLLNWIFK